MTDSPSDTYAKLSAIFDKIEVVNGFDTITAEQCVSRLNEALGYDGWSFYVKEHGIHEESDTAWSLGRLEVYRDDGVVVVREQFGSQKLGRFRSGNNSGQVIDLANDLMGAATGALKKCASLVGVALYLRAKKSGGTQQRDEWVRRQEQPRQASPGGSARDLPRPTQVILCKHPTGERDADGKLVLCGKRLEAVPDKNWAVGQLANAGQDLLKFPMCWGCFQVEQDRATKTG